MDDQNKPSGPSGGPSGRGPFGRSPSGPPAEPAGTLAEDRGGDPISERPPHPGGSASGGFADTADVALLLPGGRVARRRARQILSSADRDAKHRLVALLLTYAEWDEIWDLIEPATVRKMLPKLGLPPTLRRAWGRYLETAPD